MRQRTIKIEPTNGCVMVTPSCNSCGCNFAYFDEFNYLICMCCAAELREGHTYNRKTYYYMSNKHTDDYGVE